jgi:hypothetical protein
MQSVDWEAAIKAMSLILESPLAEKGYDDLAKFYASKGMKEEEDSIRFLLQEKINVNSSNIGEKQQGDN